jgi:uncharacterized protein YukE
MKINRQLYRNAKIVRYQLKFSRLYSNASIRDAVEMAADNLRQMAHEAREAREAREDREI